MKARTEMSLRIAKSRGDRSAVEKLTALLNPYPELDLHFANGFAHPSLVVYTSDAPRDPQLSTWGLVPSWVKSNAQKEQLWNQTLNARAETMFEKAAFRQAARERRCIVHVEGYFEHHHFGKRTYPYFIRLRDRDQFALAGLWEEWKDPTNGGLLRTFSIVTTDGNDLMRRIHNNPKLEGPRMPVILTEADEAVWLAPWRGETDSHLLLSLCKPYPAEDMLAHPVRPLLGANGTGNSERASEPFDYPELALADPLA